jgi:hypothetical protein
MVPEKKIFKEFAVITCFWPKYNHEMKVKVKSRVAMTYLKYQIFNFYPTCFWPKYELEMKVKVKSLVAMTYLKYQLFNYYPI